MKSFSPSSIRYGFSLIELLVGVAVIGVLAAIVVSVTTEARSRADLAKNVMQLRMIGLACMNFAVDNGGRIPVNVENYPYRSAGRWVGRGSGLRELLSTKWEGGTGSTDYLASPDSFYGPFTPRLDEYRKTGEFVPNGHHYEIGYFYFSLPAESNNMSPDNPSMSDNLANDYLGTENNQRTPLLCDGFTDAVVEQTGFNGPMLSVLHLDGSVSTFPLEKMQNVRSPNTYIAVAMLAGLID